MDIIRIRNNAGGTLCHGEHQLRERRKQSMTILFAVAGTPLACFAEGAILAASVYLVSRGVKNPLRTRRK